MKNLLILCLFLTSCMEEITPIVKSTDQKTIMVSSNAVITVTIYNFNYSITITHNPNQVQGTKVYVPNGEYSYTYDCGAGVVYSDQIYLPCP